MQNLQLGDARPALVLSQPWLPFKQLWLVEISRRHPAMAFAEQANEVGPAAIDLPQAQRKRLSLLGLLLRHPPAQVDVNQLDALGPAPVG